ncbi:MAG: hypothetical protein AAF959_00405 [Cyanobacteria bacterium P01_D01_bin.56]
MSSSQRLQVQHDIAAWVKVLARLGYLAKSTVYLSLGILAVQAALNLGGDTTVLREHWRLWSSPQL